MEDEVALVLHESVPVAVVDNNEVLLQLLVTLTEGVVGVDLGDAVPVPAALVQLFAVAVTE